MSVQYKKNGAQLALQKRIEELEQENNRLYRELEERKQAEETSRRNETLYRMLAANLPNGAVFLVDHDLRYLLADGQALHAAGISSGSLEGKTVWEAWDAETAARYAESYRQVLSGETFVVEHQERNSRDLISRGVPLLNEQGQVVAALVLSYDITDRKTTEEALAESERQQQEITRLLELDQARLAAVLRDLPVGIWIADQNGRLIASNAEADQIWAGESPLLNSIDEYHKYVAWYPGNGRLLQPEDYPVAMALKTGQSVEPVELKIRRFDGSEGTVLASAAPIKDREGMLTGAVGVNVDITERKRLEEALRESEFRFRTMADGTPIIIWVTRPEGQIEFINRAYCDFFDVTLDQVRSGSWQMLVHPDDHASYVDLYMDCLKEQRPFQGQCRVRRKDGEWRWIVSHADPRLSETGEFLGMAGSSFDITERMKTEQALRESEKIYRAIGEAIPYGIWICDPEGRNIYASQSYLDLVGITQQQCSDFGWGDTLHPDDMERTLAAWKECVRTGELWDIKHRFRGTDGQYHPILARGIPVRNEQGQVICWAGINLDISQLMKAEQDLKTSQEHFQIALKNSPMLVYTTDRDLRYTWIYDPIFGMDAANVIGKTDEELEGPEGVAELVAFKRSVLESGIGRRQEIRLRHQDREYFFDVTAEPVRGEPGAVTGLTVAAIDITEKKQMEQVSRENQIRIELQSRLMALREQERLGIAQDIHDGPTQTLISTILDLQITREMVNDPALQIELNQIGLNIKTAVQELRDVITQLRPPSLERLGLSRALRMHADNLNDKYPELKLTHDIADDQGRLSTDVCLSLFRIHQEALHNIIRHAEASKAHVRFSFAEDTAVLEVEDNGKGLDAIPDLTSQMAQGHYGLAGMKERAEIIRGEFQLMSAPGKGTTVTVKVPVTRKR